MSKGAIFAILSGLMLSAYSILNRYVYLNYDFDSTSYVVTFVVTSGFFALVHTLFTGRLKTNYRLGASSIKELLIVGVSGTTAIGLFVLGQGFTSATNAGILITVTVLTTAAFSFLMLRERFSSTKKLWLLLMIVGLYISIVGLRRLEVARGDVIILVATLLFGFTNVYSKTLMKKYDSSLIANTRLVFGGLLFFVVGVVLKGTGVIVLEAGAFPFIAGFLAWLTILLFNKAMSFIQPSSAIVIGMMSPIVTIAGAAVFLSETITELQVIGAIITVFSVYKINTSR